MADNTPNRNKHNWPMTAVVESLICVSQRVQSSAMDGQAERRRTMLLNRDTLVGMASLEIDLVTGDGPLTFG